jgi:N-acetylmuramoyl-L-alanine amidase
MTVVVNPGHNGGNANHPATINRLVPAGRGQRKACDTTGTATARGYAESAFNWSVAVSLRRLLTADGAKVVMTRSSDAGVGPCVNVRAAIGNAAHAAAVISIHADGAPPGGRGFHVIYPPDAGATAAIYRPSLRLAHAVHDALVAAKVFPTSTYLGQAGYDQRSDLAGLNLSTQPAIFVELGNMDNPTDAGLQTNAAVRLELARALRRGLVQFLTRR